MIKFTIVVTISAEVNGIDVTELEAYFRSAQQCFLPECDLTVTLHPVENSAARRALQTAQTTASSTASVFKDGNTLSAVRNASYEFAQMSATQAGNILNQPVSEVDTNVNEREDTEPRAVAPPPPSAPPTPPPPSSPSPDVEPQSTDPPCFPSSATAALRDGRTVRLDELREGDAILVGWADGTLGFDVVSSFSLADPSAKAAFLSLATATATVTLTPTHKLPAGPAKALKQASEVAVGETIWLASPAAGTLVQARLYPQHHTPLLSRCDPPSSPGQEPVLKITTVVADGLHSPLTMRGGWPVVDGVATSYSSAAVVARNKYLVPLVEAVCPTLGRLVVAAVNPKPMHYIDGEVSPLPPSQVVSHLMSPLHSSPPHRPRLPRSRPKVVEPISSLEVAAAVAVTAAATLGVRKITARK